MKIRCVTSCVTCFHATGRHSRQVVLWVVKIVMGDIPYAILPFKEGAHSETPFSGFTVLETPYVLSCILFCFGLEVLFLCNISKE